MEKEKKKKRKLKWQVKLFFVIIIILIYAFFLGTKGIFIKEYKVNTNKIDEKMHGLKILQFSDLHFGSSVNEQMVKNLVKKINQTKPDIVIFSGDLINEGKKITSEQEEIIIKELSNIDAELGKYYVTGEEDFKEATSILNISGFINLENNPQTIYSGSSKPILLIDKSSVKQYFETNQNIPEFKILALHDPDDFDDFKDYEFDMAIAGHTHGGQINIIKLKDMLIKSKYKKDFQKVGKTNLYVNTGIGTSVIPARMFNQPTIYLYRINKTS